MEKGNDHYQISEASKVLEIEAHVLRYWEEEMGIDIPRNEMGHRLYTEDHMRIFRKIKEMKEEGFQLRAIRRSLEAEFPGYLLELEKDEENAGEGMEAGQDEPEPETCYAPVHVLEVQEDDELAEPDSAQEDRLERLEALQSLMSQIIAQALERNNERLGRQISDDVADQVIREMDILSRYQEEKEEERFRKLDETIRCCQRNDRYRREAAAARSPLSIFRNRTKKKRFRKRSI